MTPAEELSDYFGYAKRTFQNAVENTKLQSRWYFIGGSHLRLDFAGEALSERFFIALEHNRVVEGANVPDLEVSLWDTASTGCSLQPPPWSKLPFSERGNRRIYMDEAYVLIYDRRTSVFNMIDLHAGRALYWVRDASWLPYYEIAAPLRYLLQGWWQSRDTFVVHSAAVGFPDGGALIVGPTGSGKSSTSLSCLDSVLGFAGDDYILVQSSPGPTAFSLYNSAKINVADLEMYPALRKLIANPERLDVEKALIFLQEDYRERLINSFPLRVLILPHVGDGAETTYEETGSVEAFKRIAPDSVFTMLGNSRLIFRGIRELTQQLPCYHFTLGHDRQQVVASIVAVIQRHTP